jgi:hypothetical protein
MEAISADQITVQIYDQHETLLWEGQFTETYLIDGYLAVRVPTGTDRLDPGNQVTVTVDADVTDLAGNAIDSAHRTASATAS